NYLNAIQSDVFWRVVLNSLLWAGIVVVFQFLLGLGSALLLNRNFHGQALARALVILPWVTPASSPGCSGSCCTIPTSVESTPSSTCLASRTRGSPGSAIPAPRSGR